MSGPTFFHLDNLCNSDSVKTKEQKIYFKKMRKTKIEQDEK